MQSPASPSLPPKPPKLAKPRPPGIPSGKWKKDDPSSRPGAPLIPGNGHLEYEKPRTSCPALPARPSKPVSSKSTPSKPRSSAPVIHDYEDVASFRPPTVYSPEMEEAVVENECWSEASADTQSLSWCPAMDIPPPVPSPLSRKEEEEGRKQAAKGKTAVYKYGECSESDKKIKGDSPSVSTFEEMQREGELQEDTKANTVSPRSSYVKFVKTNYTGQPADQLVGQQMTKVSGQLEKIEKQLREIVGQIGKIQARQAEVENEVVVLKSRGGNSECSNNEMLPTVIVGMSPSDVSLEISHCRIRDQNWYYCMTPESIGLQWNLL